MVQAVFAKGVAPAVAARALRKFADMLEGYHRYAIANVGLGKQDLDYATRLEDGRVEIVNGAQQYQDWCTEDKAESLGASHRSKPAGTP